MDYDVIIVGGGIIGVSCAYYIKKNSPGKKVLLVEKDADIAQESTAKAAGMFRNTFSSKTNHALTETSIDFFIHLQKDMRDISLKLDRYIWLFSRDQFDKMAPVIKSMQNAGIELKILEMNDLKKIRGLNTDIEKDEEAQMMGLKDVYKGVLSMKCGSIDQYEVSRFYKEEFEKMGGEVMLDTKVEKLLVVPKNKLGIPGEPFLWQDLKVGGIVTKQGEVYSDKVVVATGAYANELLDPIGVDCHMKPKKRILFQVQGKPLEELLNTKGFNEMGTIPFTILPKSGIYIKAVKGENCFWVSCPDNLGVPFDSSDVSADAELYQYSVHPILSKYFPQFTNLPVKNAWAGLYEYNTTDRIPYIFEKQGVIVVTGCSGSGIMKADAVGRIADGCYRGAESVELYGGTKFKVSDLGVEKRNVEREEFLI